MNKIVKALLYVESIYALGAGLFLPIFAIFSQKIGGDIFDAGVAAALFLIATSTLEWPIGIWLDKFKEKWFLAGDYFLEAFVFLGYIFVGNKWELFALQIVLGVASAIGNPAWESLYDKNTPNITSGRSWARAHMYIGYCAGFGILIGSFLAQLYGFNVVFLLGSVFSFIAGISTIIFLKK